VTDRDLMQQALDALQICKPEYPNTTPSRRTYNSAVTALRERLAQPEQEPLNGDKVKQLVSKCTHRDLNGNWYVDGVQLVHETCFALDAIKRTSATPPAAQPAMFGPMGTVGDLFDKHVIANGNLKKEWIVYLEKNT
jgi:hypothetical protein